MHLSGSHLRLLFLQVICNNSLPGCLLKPQNSREQDSRCQRGTAHSWLESGCAQHLVSAAFRSTARTTKTHGVRGSWRGLTEAIETCEGTEMPLMWYKCQSYFYPQAGETWWHMVIHKINKYYLRT